MAGRLTARTRGSASRRARGRLVGMLLTAALMLPLAVGSVASDAHGAAVPDSGAPDTAAPADGAMPQTSLARTEAAAVEKHIVTLHRKLQITPAQEPLWQALAGTMRESVVRLDHVYAQRQERYGTMSAVDDLKSYGLVQDVRARNVQSLIDPFRHLYDSFSDSQKKAADETFRDFTSRAVRNQR